MGRIVSLSCHRCRRTYPPGRWYMGCSVCADDKPSNLVLDTTTTSSRGRSIDPHSPTANRRCGAYHEFLPAEIEHAVTLGEGYTPLVKCRHLGRSSASALSTSRTSRAIRPRRSRTASPPPGVSYALRAGDSVITAASSGNGGAAAAAYAARAGLDAVILTTEQFHSRCACSCRRTARRCSRRRRWPVVGRSCGRASRSTAGFRRRISSRRRSVRIRTLSTAARRCGYEICEQLEWRLPDWVVAPIGSGDSMVGIWKGIREWLDLGIAASGGRHAAHGGRRGLRVALGRPRTRARPHGSAVDRPLGGDLRRRREQRVPIAARPPRDGRSRNCRRRRRDDRHAARACRRGGIRRGLERARAVRGRQSAAERHDPAGRDSRRRADLWRPEGSRRDGRGVAPDPGDRRRPRRRSRRPSRRCYGYALV